MKPWFDTYCKSCHASGGSAANKWKYDSDDFNNTIKNQISSIHSTVVIQKSMPQGINLSAAELQKLIDWYNAGYPIN
jgi:cytochrome c5